MRIAHVSDCYLPRTGGIETQVRALALQQHARGDDVRVITATPGSQVRQGHDLVDGLPVERITVPLPMDLPVHPRTRAAVVRTLRDHPADVAHVHAGVISPFAWGAVRAARELGMPCLVTVHSVWGPLSAPGFGASDAIAGWSRWGVQLSAVSQLAADRVTAAVPGLAPVLVVPNGIDPVLWSGVVPVAGPPGVLRAVTVMRLAPRKRIIPLLRIVAMANGGLLGTASVRLTVIGDGPERGTAQRWAREHGLDDLVTFAGRLGREQIREQFARADLFVQPSVRESFGLAALEARSAGLPVLARAQTGTAGFIRPGIEGLLADSDREMARALIRVARDRAELDVIAAHNRSTEPEQAWPVVLDDVTSAYAAAVERMAAAGARK